MAASKVTLTAKDYLVLIGLVVLFLFLVVLGPLYFFIIRPVEKRIIKIFCREKEIPAVFIRNN